MPPFFESICNTTNVFVDIIAIITGATYIVKRKFKKIKTFFIGFFIGIGGSILFKKQVAPKSQLWYN